MRRSYLLIKENDFLIYHNQDLYNADNIIIDVYDASCIFSNFEKFQDVFNTLKAHDIRIYLKVDTENIKKGYQALEQIKGSYITGWFIDNPLPHILNHFLLKCREYELNNKLPFKSIDFMVVMDNLKHVVHLKKIMKTSRVKEIILKESISDNEYIKDKVIFYANLYHKDIISYKAVTHNLKEVYKINQQYDLDMNTVNASLDFINNFIKSSKEEQKQLLKNNSLYKHYEILKNAKRLNLIKDYPIIPYVIVKKNQHIVKENRVIKKFYTLGEEIANAVSHGAGAILAIVGLVILMIKGGSTQAVISYLIFSTSALILYLMSTLYHALALSKSAKHIFQKFDHMTIYLLIAGTYTPFSLLAIGGATGNLICAILWIGCLIGFLLNIFAFGKYRFLHMFLYVALGWVAILFMPEITAHMAPNGVILLIAGGVMYTVGIFFYALKLFKFTHMVWHIFTLFGSVLHFLAVLLYL